MKLFEIQNNYIIISDLINNFKYIPIKAENGKWKSDIELDENGNIIEIFAQHSSYNTEESLLNEIYVFTIKNNQNIENIGMFDIEYFYPDDKQWVDEISDILLSENIITTEYGVVIPVYNSNNSKLKLYFSYNNNKEIIAIRIELSSYIKEY